MDLQPRTWWRWWFVQVIVWGVVLTASGVVRVQAQQLADTAQTPLTQSSPEQQQQIPLQPVVQAFQTQEIVVETGLPVPAKESSQNPDSAATQLALSTVDKSVNGDTDEPAVNTTLRTEPPASSPPSKPVRLAVLDAKQHSLTESEAVALMMNPAIDVTSVWKAKVGVELQSICRQHRLDVLDIQSRILTKCLDSFLIVNR